jgi:putative pyruvate formate lyase activating enzyme
MARLESCDICPNDCGVNRLDGEVGMCGAGAEARVASYNLHFGEEPAISGTRGSGTIFFSHCTLKCAYCQNWPISHEANGNGTDARGLAQMMLELQSRGAHNINFVTPSHYMPHMLDALVHAIDDGFKLPIVYNTSAYDTVMSLRLLDGIVDVHLPDMRYSDDGLAKKYSRAKSYTNYNRAAIREMHRQVGDLVMDEDGLAVRGLIVRHLVLPDNISGTEDVMRFIAEEISVKTAISLMDQYFPTYRADGFPELSRRITREEFERAEKIMDKYGLEEGWVQEHV